MELAKFVCGGKMEPYRKIEWANAHFVRSSEEGIGDAAEIDSQEDQISLLAKGNNGEVELHEISEMSSVKTHKTSIMIWKPSPNHPKEKIELRIHKMDNTSFTVDVPKKATVLGLKKALQEKFDMTGCQISWPHVWGNFCLTFNNQKLLDNSISLQTLGIRNSDELYFVRHLTLPSQSRRRAGFFQSIRKKSA